MKNRRPKIAWLAGTRGEVLRLGPIYRAIAPSARGSRHALALTGIQGVGTYQSVDLLDLHPDAEFELRHPAEDPAIRFHGLMAEIERFLRNERASRVIVTGFGPTSAAAALTAHARRCPTLWVRPPDPARLNQRMHWEHALSGILRSLSSVTVIEAPFLQGAGREIEDREGAGERDESTPRSEPVTGRRTGAPLALIAMGRRLWSGRGVLDRLMKSSVAWAKSYPAADWVILRSLEARLEGLIRSFPNQPPNLLTLEPVPQPDYIQVFGEASVVLTDSCDIAAECVATGRPAAVMGELPPMETRTAPHHLFEIVPKDLGAPDLQAFLEGHLKSPPLPCRPKDVSSIWQPKPETIESIQQWIEAGVD